MFKILGALALSIVLSADSFIVVDIAQGMKKHEYKELGKLAYPDKKVSSSIYENGEKVYLYAFNGTQSLSNEFEYSEKNENETQWKKGKNSYLSFFKKVRKEGVKKNKYVNANIIFVVDTSGSMKHDGVMEQVKDTMRYLVKAKSKKSRIAVVSFDGKQGMKDSKKARIVQNFTSSKSDLIHSIDSIHYSKYDTFMGEGLERAKSLLSNAKPNTLVLLFTDGKAIDDKNKALNIVKQFKRDKVKLKVVAVGGADVDMLKQFSTTGYVFNATSSDLKEMSYAISLGSDEIFLRLNNFFENSPALKPNDNLIMYSSMMNVDNENDFYVVPNLASKAFYKEVQGINKLRGVKLNLQGVKVYIRLLGKMSASDVNTLKQFWKRYFQDSGAKLMFFANSSLHQNKFD